MTHPYITEYLVNHRWQKKFGRLPQVRQIIRDYCLYLCEISPVVQAGMWELILNGETTLPGTPICINCGEKGHASCAQAGPFTFRTQYLGKNDVTLTIRPITEQDLQCMFR